MPVTQNLYQIYKLTSTQIIEANLELENYTRYRAVKDGTLVSIGDNLVFQKLRDYYGDTRSHVEIFEKVQELRKTLRMCKKAGQINEAKIVNQCISDILFVKDIINVECVKKSEYKKLAKGFVVNGIRYIRFLAGAGQVRRNTATFINEDLYSYMEDCLMCGVNKKIENYNLAKLSAYFALNFSSILWVRTPRVCIIKDFETTLKEQDVDFIAVDDKNNMSIERRIMDITLNCADGQGLVDPEFSKLWAEDMRIDFLPSSFVVRSAFIKGNMVPFDFKKYGRVHGITTIKDRWGKEYHLDDIDVLVSESQFKMYKFYDSWEEYLDYFTKGGLRWGVARYNKKYDDENVLANYQYIQVLKLKPEDIDELIAPTIEWIKNICSGDDLFSILFTLGCKDEDIEYNRYYGTAQANYSKAIVKNKDFLKDSYVQRKIYQNIVECINRAKIGKVWVRGNYQFMISDPVAQCQSALGMPVCGILPPDKVYSKFWIDRGVTDKICLSRSPMVDKSEHVLSELYQSTDTDEWYQHIKSGVIYSIYDLSTMKHSDSDWDGDIVFSTNNAVFLRCAQTENLPITYDKGAPPIQKNTMANRIKTDIRGFGTGVGGFSNCTTIIEAMKAIFDPETQSDMIEELTNRQKMLRRIIGQEIDRIKGLEKPVLPSSWKKFVKINENDTDAEKAAKYKHNALVIHKKPYFFRYLYPELNRRFKHYESSYNLISKDMFGVKLKKLLMKPDKTEEEMNLVRRYQKYSPLIVSNCSMNILCKKFESIDFDIKFCKATTNMLPLFENCGYQTKPEALKVIKECYRKYNNKRTVKMAESIFRDYSEDDVKEIYFNINEAMKIDIQTTLFGLGLDVKELMYHIGVLSKEYANFNWSFAWNMLEEQIIDLLPRGETLVAVKNEEGTEYLGQRYKLKNIFKNEGEYENAEF